MSLTQTPIRRMNLGSEYGVVADFTFDSTYPTGGEPVDLVALGFPNDSCDFMIAAPAGGLIFEYVRSTKKLIAKYPTGGGAVPAALGAPTVAVPAGATTVTSSAAQPNLTETAGIGVEVANATNLSTITTQIFAIGR